MPAKVRRRRTSQKRSLSLGPKLAVFLKVILTILVLLAIGLSLFSWHQWRSLKLRDFKQFAFVVQEREAPEITRLIILSIEESTRTDLYFSSELRIPVVHGYGEYRAAIIPDLGIQEGYGYELLSESITQWFGVNATDVIRLKNISRLHSLTSMLRAESTLDFWERIWLWLQLIDVSSTDFKEVNLVENSYFQVKNNAVTLSEVNRNKLATEYFFSSRIAAMDKQIVIVNATSQYGLASRVADLLIAFGYDVVALQDSTEPKATTSIMIEEGSEIEADYLQPLTDLFLHKKPDEVSSLREYRGDVIIILGEDYASLVSSL